MSQVPIATSTLSFPAHRARWRAGAVGTIARSRESTVPLFGRREVDYGLSFGISGCESVGLGVV